MSLLPRDIRHAVRALLRAPVLFAAAVLTLAAGIGLATGVVAVAYGVLLRPLPYPAPDRLVAILLHPPGEEQRNVGVRLPEFDEWRSRLRAFERIAGHASAEFTLRGSGDPRTARTAMVSDGFFETLGVRAVEGSTDAVTRGAASAVLSSSLAETLGRDGAWRERGLTIGTSDFRVAAVLPPWFTLPAENTEVWVLAGDVPEISLYGSQDQRRFQLFGRLARGVSIEQAREDVQRVAREIDGGETPGRQRHATVRPLDERRRQEARPTMIPFVIGSALVLLIACANVSGLLVGRASSREREFAVRRALGGSGGQILRAALAESFTVAFLGWTLGLWLAVLVIEVFESLAAGALPNLQAVRIDTPVLIVSLALAVLVAVLSACAPALRATRADPSAALKHSSDRAGRAGSAVRGALVVSQIALTVVLLVSAALLMRTVSRILTLERGFVTENAVAMRLRLTQTIRFEVNESTPFINRLMAHVRALPGVVAAGVGSDLPPNGTQLEMTIRIVRDNRDTTFALSPSAVTPGYLEALGIGLVKGRLFEERDRLADVPRIVVTEAAARMMFDDRDPVGQEWPAAMPGPAGKRVRPLVVGVVRDIKHRGLDNAAPAVMFVPWERLAPSNAHLVVRTAGNPQAIASALRRIVQELDPTLPLFAPRSLDEVVAGSLASRRLRLQLAGGFAALALALAVVALWGAMAQTVLDRRRELAVRLALGSTHGAAVILVLRAGLILIAAGVVLGVVAGGITARMLQHLLHGVAPFDPLAFGGGVAVATLISAVACYVPARRAAAISPAELLRQG